MALLIKAKIKVSKIQKWKITTNDKGEKLYEIEIYVRDTPDQFGNDVTISQYMTPQERRKGVKVVYLGNGKITEDTDKNTEREQEPGKNC